MTEPWIANRGETWVETESRPFANYRTVVISITEPGRQAHIPTGFADVLRLEFKDYDPVGKDITDSGMYSSPPRAHVVPKGEEGSVFTRQQAARISRFARKHRGKNFLVHCAAGISRSGAVAEVLLQAFPEYTDHGWPRFPNGHVRSVLKVAMGMVPIGYKEVE